MASEPGLTTTNTATVMGFVENYVGGNVEKAMEFIHPDMVANEADSLPYGGDWRGKDGFLGLMNKIDGIVSHDATPEALHDVGTAVIAVILAKFTSVATGASVEMRTVEIYGITDGLISSADVFYKDTKAFLDELGL